MEQQNVTPEDLAAQPLDGIGNNAKTEDFRMKNKVYEIIKYGKFVNGVSNKGKKSGQ